MYYQLGIERVKVPYIDESVLLVAYGKHVTEEHYLTRSTASHVRRSFCHAKRINSISSRQDFTASKNKLAPSLRLPPQ